MSQNTHMVPVNIGNGNANCGNVTSSFNSNVCESDADPSGQLSFSPTYLNTLEEISDCEISVSDWADTIIPSAEPHSTPQPPTSRPRKFRYSPSQTAPHPNNSSPTPPIVVNHRLIIACSVCILAFLIFRYWT